MHVVVLQPPVPSPVLLDQAEGRLAHLAPPWDALALLGFLAARTRHGGSLFDARLRTGWREDLAERLVRADAADLVLLHIVRGGEESAREAAALIRSTKPHLPVVLFGSAIRGDPRALRERIGATGTLAGDPEPTVRSLLDNFDDDFRRRRIPGLCFEDGPDRAVPQFVPDLRTLALPAWASVPWSTYESPGFRGGLCAELALSRGFSGDPVDAADRATDAPLRIWPMDRLVDALQECAHLGMTEVRFLDPPGVWNVDRLQEWLFRLGRIRNAQDWSLRLLPEPVDEVLLARLIGHRCRRIEWLVPTTDPARLADLQFDIDWKGAAATRRWLHAQGVQVDLVFRLGDPAEPAGEAARVLRLLKTLGGGAFGLELHPEARSDGRHRAAAAATAREIRRRLTLNPAHRLLTLARRLRHWRAAGDEERRAPLVGRK